MMRSLLALATILALSLFACLAPVEAAMQRGGRGGRPVRVGTVNVNITFTFNGDAGKVRTSNPPEQFDDKGKPKKLTLSELRKLKGDDPAEKKLVGYKSDIAEVQPGAVIQVTLSTNKALLRKAAKKGKGDLGGDKDGKDDSKPSKGGKWVTVRQLTGVVTKAQEAKGEGGSTITIKVTQQILNNTGGNTNQDQTISPDEAQATLIVITKRAEGKEGARKGKNKE
jgi:hypothetical protein